jgi:hypothetical protein
MMKGQVMKTFAEFSAEFMTDWDERFDPADTAWWEAITEILNHTLIVDKKELLDPVDVALACSAAALEVEGKIRRFTDGDGEIGWELSNKQS